MRKIVFILLLAAAVFTAGCQLQEAPSNYKLAVDCTDCGGSCEGDCAECCGGGGGGSPLTSDYCGDMEVNGYEECDHPDYGQYGNGIGQCDAYGQDQHLPPGYLTGDLSCYPPGHARECEISTESCESQQGSGGENVSEFRTFTGGIVNFDRTGQEICEDEGYSKCVSVFAHRMHYLFDSNDGSCSGDVQGYNHFSFVLTCDETLGFDDEYTCVESDDLYIPGEIYPVPTAEPLRGDELVNFNLGFSGITCAR